VQVDGCWRPNEEGDYKPYVNRSYTIASEALLEASRASGRPVVYHPSGWSELPPVRTRPVGRLNALSVFS
jgi:hypothetical protein